MKAQILAVALVVSIAQAQAPARVDHADHHEFVIANFKTESGVTLPQARVVYGTYGHLDAAKDNVVLLPSHYMANHHGYEWLIGPGLALDTTKLFLVATELFGNGSSSSPSNTPEPFHGPRFPVTTIRDNVEAVHRLLVEELGVRHLRAVIGFSMGAQQSFQWAVSYPTYMDRIVATSGTAKTYGHGVMRLEGQIAAITADPTFNNGDYSAEPKAGLEAFGMVWGAWLYSQEWWRRELWRAGSPPGTTQEQFIQSWRRRFSADANNYILQAHTWEQHNVGNTPGFGGDVEKALRSIAVPVLYMPSETDLYFPVGDARYEAQFIPKVQLAPIPSLWGHPAGAGASPEDKKFLNEKIAAFLAENSSHAPASDSAGRAVLQRMHDAYAGRWYTTLRFVQKTTQYQADGKKAIATWYESLRQPPSGKTQLRIDIGDPHDGNGVLYTADSSWRFRDGKLTAARASGNEFLPIIEGVYFQPVDQTMAELASTKLDFSRVVHGSWQGQPVTIIGAASVADTSSTQLWIEDARNIAVRMLFGPSGPQALDIKLDDYVAVGGGWLATKIVMTRGGMPLQTEEYADWKVGVDLSNDYFSPTAWVPKSHWAYR